MTLVLNEEQVMLRDAASGFLSEKANLSHLREMRDSDGDSPYDICFGLSHCSLGVVDFHWFDSLSKSSASQYLPMEYIFGHCVFASRFNNNTNLR